MHVLLEKTQYYTIRVEFQVGASPHTYLLIWKLNALTLTKSTLHYGQENYFVELPDLKTESELWDLIKSYQIHSYSKICKQYQNQFCRFHFDNFLKVKLSA